MGQETLRRPWSRVRAAWVPGRRERGISGQFGWMDGGTFLDGEQIGKGPEASCFGHLHGLCPKASALLLAPSKADIPRGGSLFPCSSLSLECHLPPPPPLLPSSTSSPSLKQSPLLPASESLPSLKPTLHHFGSLRKFSFPERLATLHTPCPAQGHLRPSQDPVL